MKNFLNVLHYWRLAPFDTSTEQGRIAERYRLMMWAVVTNVMSRGAAMLVIVLAVNLTIPYLGVERFGVWMAIISMASMLTFLDMGVGNALTNRVAQVASLDDMKALRSAISGGLCFLLVVALCVGLLLVTLAAILPWEKIIKVEDKSIVSEIKNACIVFSVLFSVGLFSNGVQRVFFGLQRAYEANIAIFLGAVSSMVALFLVAESQLGVVSLLIATLGVQQAVTFILLLRLKQLSLLACIDGILSFSIEKSTLIKVGGLFFILQLGAIVSTGMDGLLISSTLGSAQVAIYALVQRLYQFVSVPIYVLNAPLWSVYADAHVRGEGRFIIRTLRRSLIVSAAIALGGGSLLALFSPQIFAVWTKGMMQVPMVIVVVYFGLMVFESVGNSLAMMLNGCSIVKEQVVVILFLMVFGLGAKIAGLYYDGIQGMLLGWLLLYSFSLVFFYGFLWRRRIVDNILLAR